MLFVMVVVGWKTNNQCQADQSTGNLARTRYS
jgi:hypothetical protein